MHYMNPKGYDQWHQEQHREASSSSSLEKNEDDFLIGAASEKENNQVVSVLIRGSYSTKSLGGGGRGAAQSTNNKSYFLLENHTFLPPSPLENINVKVWRRFYIRMKQTKTIGRQHSVPVMVVIVPWSFLLSMGDGIEDSAEVDGVMPVWFVVSFSILSILLCVTFVNMIIHLDGASLKAEEGVVTKMKQAFELQGYSTEYVNEANCCGMWLCPRRCTLVRFTRISTAATRRGVEKEKSLDLETSAIMTEAGGAADNNYEGETTAKTLDNDCIFRPLLSNQNHGLEAWWPLKGVWKLKRVSKKEHENPKWFVDGSKNSTIKIFTTTANIHSESYDDSKGGGGTYGHNNNALVFEGTMEKEMFLGLCMKKITTYARTDSNNHLVFDTLEIKKTKEIIEKMEDEERKLKSQKVLDVIVDGATFYSVGLGGRYASIAYYRNKFGDRVWKIDGDTMTIYSIFEDESILDEDILAGRLEDIMIKEVQEGQMEWMEYQRVANQPSLDTTRNGTNVSTLDDSITRQNTLKWKRALHKKLYFTASIQTPAIVIFFSVSSRPSFNAPEKFRFLLIVTGVCGLLNCFYTLFLRCRDNASIPRAIMWSVLYLLCLITVCSSLCVTWNDWVPYWQSPFVFGVVGFLGVFLMAALANTYWYQELRKIDDIHCLPEKRGLIGGRVHIHGAE